MIFIDLNRNEGFKWFEKDNIRVKGYLYDDKGNLYDNINLVDFFINVESLEDFISKIKKVNGSFSVVVNNNRKVYAAVDPLRSLPLFYIKDKESLFVSDSGWSLIRKRNQSEVDDIGVSEFLLSGYTVGNYTLFNDLRQIQAGQYLYYNDETNELKLDFYYKHLHGDYLTLSKNKYFERLDSIYTNVFSRLIQSVKGRTIVIPLSGGYDSRSIAAMLKKLGYNNVICYTYGRPESFEVQTSEKVAKELGFKWYFVDYTEKEKWKNIIHDEKYLFFASNASSLPHVQEYIALSELKKRLLIPNDAVIVPGFCGDLLGGSYVPKEIISGKEHLLFERGIEDYVLFKHFNLDNKISNKQVVEIKKRISEELVELGSEKIKNTSDFDSVSEAFFTNHKVAKFVVNALRPYEYFGYEWRMPLWDRELYEFYYQVPLEYRVNGNKLYNSYLFERLFDPLNIGFTKKPKQVESFLNLAAKISLVEKAAHSVIKLYKAIRRKNRIDFNAFSNLYDLCRKELSAKGLESFPSTLNINSIFALWFVQYFLVKKKIFK